MASEELLGNDLTQAPAPTTTLPQYPEMIISTIKSLNEANGSNKSAISKHIEATYGTLPPAHTTLLSHHLNKLRSTGQLQFIKNNYLIPDPTSPPRRGRGRPPKPKTPLPSGVLPLSPRPRGRPPKSRDPTASPPKALSGKKRGRPPKVAATSAAVPATPPAAGGVRRGRGRPPKVKPAATAPVGA
ncbi:hypothetical protein ACS0TY_033578 [Phlomoides rotata]